MTRTNTGKRQNARRRRFLFNPLALFFLAAIVLFARIVLAPGAASARSMEQSALQTEPNLLRLLGITASPESIDFVLNKSQFQLHTLLTEQRHQKTWNLSDRIRTDTEAGLRMLFSVDEDISARLDALAAEKAPLDQLVTELESAILEKKKIYVYGCGATGRLAKQMESSFWRPFWKRIKADAGLWSKCSPSLDPAVEDELIGEMTGADRALISSLEGFEDLQLIGRLQLKDRAVKKGDLVICVTEGGETSSVIGTILAAHDQWKAEAGYAPEESRKRLYFVYNNPDDRLLPFERSRKLIQEPGITKINLSTGPQAITGSTRMQATTIETFVIGSAIETAVEHVLRRILSKKDIVLAGFKEESTLQERLRKFPLILQEIRKHIANIARLTDLEYRTYTGGHFTTYFAKSALITVFIDSTERSPTFRLYPLDTVDEPERKCWIQVWTEAPDRQSAWRAFLGRPFRGLTPALYQKPFEEEVDDPYLREKALVSLTKAGDSEQNKYDFSFSDLNVKKRGPKPGDLGISVLLGPEVDELSDSYSSFQRFDRLFSSGGAGLGLILIANRPVSMLPYSQAQGKTKTPLARAVLEISSENDPFLLQQHIALKMLLNAHSTAVMAKLGRVVGNTMTNVSPSNLKLIGRATHIIQVHVNDVLGNPAWVLQYGTRRPISYGEANAVLFDSMAFLKDRPQDSGQAAEVPLSIIRILESIRRKRDFTAEEALGTLKTQGLDAFLSSVTSGK
jgi:N-acetylmuramic acid 6-phosphate (MurNAc-6-P) etherase